MNDFLNEHMKQIPTALEATGFVFEYQVAESFRQAGWTVIVGRYYVDDVDQKARELDLIAYKIKKSNDFDVVTSILISCKKDAENSWVVMSMPRPTQDLNINWNPVHYWTNNKLLDAYLKSKSWTESYINENKFLEENISGIARQAFAFQLISKKTQKTNNDRPVFQSITDLLKALSHEMSILPNRMKQPRVYNFNLLTVLDADLFEVGYETDTPTISQIGHFRHVARYIVNKHDLIARVNICNKTELDKLIAAYDCMAAYNNLFFNKKLTESYQAIKYSKAVQDHFSSIFSKLLPHFIKFRLSDAKNISYSSVDEIKVSIGFDDKDSTLKIKVDVDPDDVALLNSDAVLMAKTKEYLLKYARYSEKFEYEWDIFF